jgi:DNA polymerase
VSDDPALAARAARLDTLREEARGCRACPLWRPATQTVFGEGAACVPLLLVGEQPGDAEDLSGRPFVGPSGRILDTALAAAGVDRGATYVTNAVKHFKFELRGKRRVHKTPAQREIEACSPWLAAEIEAVAPRLVVCLGLTAARALLDPVASLESLRGRVHAGTSGPALLATVHPSYVLRVPPTLRAGAYDRLVADLRLAAEFIRGR